MLREELKKNIVYSQILREKIKNTESEKAKKVLINELCKVYNKLEFLRGLQTAMIKKGEYYEKSR